MVIRKMGRAITKPIKYLTNTPNPTFQRSYATPAELCVMQKLILAQTLFTVFVGT
jgi:hypothetical protein